MMSNMLLAFVMLLSAEGPPTGVPVPGEPLQVPAAAPTAGAPVVFEHSPEAGPDETFLLVGDRLSSEVEAWGVSPDRGGGQHIEPRVQFLKGGLLAATLPERAQDGVFVVRVKNAAGWSEPVVLNRPRPWWCGPDAAEPGQVVRVFGQNLARRPDQARAFVYLRAAGKPGVWVDRVGRTSKYAVSFVVPEATAPGRYEVWLHAGSGGDWGWGGPVTLDVRAKAAAAPRVVAYEAKAGGPTIAQALAQVAAQGGGELRLPEGIFRFSGTLEVPAGVTLSGAGIDRTVLQLVPDPTVRFSRLGGGGWDQAPGRVHSVGDTITYRVNVPKAGSWTVWMRYGTDMKPFGQPGVSGNHTLAVDGGPAVPLQNLDNTGSWAPTVWSKAASLTLTAGAHTLTWKNEKGGGVSLDAYVLSLDPLFKPAMTPPPVSGPDRVVFQAEDCERFVTKEGELPSGERAAVWLAGNGAGVQGLTVLGTSQVNFGIAIRAAGPLEWIDGARVDHVKVADIDGKRGENCGLHARFVLRARVVDSELWGRCPLFLSGARKSEFRGNRLVSVTRYGGNAEAAILGRTETVEECVVEGNRIASPPGAEAGGPTARRLLWFSTGHGSITHNWIAGNGVEPASTVAGVAPPAPGVAAGLVSAPGAGMARFGGVAGTDQNVGEMILFEGNHRTAYFGPLAGADAASVTLPRTLPDTPQERLGSVERKQLAHDAAGKEIPYWPPDVDDGSEEPPLGEYYVTVLAGTGQGQTRRVVKRTGETLQLDRPWRVPPTAGSTVAVATMFHQNLIVGNHAADGMTGIQLWISCVDNVVAGNTIARQRKPGLFLYGNGTTLASSMPRTWNRGISPLFWNTAEGNRADECSAGALVTSGDDAVAIEFPRALGNVLRHNSFVRSRTDGVILSSRGPVPGVKDTSASIAGTIVEGNVVRDARVAFHAGAASDATVLRRNHAYFWYPVSLDAAKPVAFQVDRPDAAVGIELNSVEGIHGAPDEASVPLRTPKGDGPLPE